MIWIILSLIFWIAVTIGIWKSLTMVYAELSDVFITMFLSLLVGLVCLLVSFALIFTFGECVEEENINYSLENDIEIIALKDNQNIQGHHYLFSGYINEDLYYYYATQTELGYVTDKVKAEDSYINYATDKPHIEKYEADSFKKKWIYLFTFPIDTRYIIYCPENTITTEFNIDLE